ncbi:MAG: hypothetical protein BWX84_02107 [Verrucomicrobia bacterium ADurb.Bin118]|jgi:hypothetical protein|nr:MAG: hypothetical protein BWX84_02107 [Verrucomicrobia bacterium ADurb.Bin118]
MKQRMITVPRGANGLRLEESRFSVSIGASGGSEPDCLLRAPERNGSPPVGSNGI